IIIDRVKGCNAIFFGPVDLKITERLIIETTDERMQMSIRQHIPDIVGMLLDTALQFPETGYPRCIHPAMKCLQISIQINRTKRNNFTQRSNEAAIDDSARNLGSERMPFAVCYNIV